MMLRSRRKAEVSSSVSGGGQEEMIEMNATSTVACIFLLISIGASLAASYIVVRSPNCLGGGIQAVGAPKNIRSPPPPPTVTIAAATTTAPGPPPVPIILAPPPAPAPPAPPVPTCTAEQKSQIEKQLPPGGCSSYPYEQACSFTVATKHGGCQDNTVYYREPIGQLSLNPGDTFTGLLLGLRENDDAPMDLLSLGSHDREKYKVDAWRTAAKVRHCAKPEVALGTTKQKAQVLVVEADLLRGLTGKRLKAATGLTDTDLRGELSVIASSGAGDSKTLNVWAQTAVPTGDVHFMRIDSTTSADADILASGAGGGGLLERVWYLEFGYNWKDGWESASLKPLIDDTLNRFACYWQGTNGNLWRITGCWLDFYQQKHWAGIVCVNVGIEGAKPIYDKMEQVFQETLKKDLVMTKQG